MIHMLGAVSLASYVMPRTLWLKRTFSII